MKKFLSNHGRALTVAAVLVPLLVLLVYVALRSGPLTAVPVTLVTVESRAVTPALFGIGGVQAQRLVNTVALYQAMGGNWVEPR